MMVPVGSVASQEPEIIELEPSESTIPEETGQSYEDLEGLSLSVGLIFALLFPSMLLLQNQSFDAGVQNKNLLTLLCTQAPFRRYIVQSIERHMPGFEWSFPLGDGQHLNTLATLEADEHTWKWDHHRSTPEDIYPCGEVREIAASARYLQAMFPKFRVDSWVLAHPDADIWSDHVSNLSSFGVVFMLAGLIGSLLIYASLSMSPGREDPTLYVVKRWSKLGLPTLGVNLVVLFIGIVLLLTTHDAYTESQDPFFLRGGRWGAYPKIALLSIFMPVTIFFGVGSIVAYVWSRRTKGEVFEETPEFDMKPHQTSEAEV